MKIENDDVLAQAGDHLPVLVAMLEGVEMVRSKALPDSRDDLDAMDLLNMIRVAYCAPIKVASLAERIDADDAAIKRALNDDADQLRKRLTAIAMMCPSIVSES